MSTARGPVVAGAILATILVVSGAAYGVAHLVHSGDGDATSAPVHVSLPTPDGRRTASVTPGVDGSTAPGPEIVEESVFYLGAGPGGPALFREPVMVFPGVGRLESAVNALMEKPDVPWYGTRWAAGWITGAVREGDVIDVSVDGAPSSRPATMDPGTAEQAVQQVVYTMQAASRSAVRVQFTRIGRPAATVLGIPASHPIGAAPPTQALAAVEVQEPEMDGVAMGRAAQYVAGVCSSPGGDVEVHLLHDGAVVCSIVAHVATAAGQDHEYPWHGNIDVHGLGNGTYSVVASRPDPTDPSVTTTDHRPMVLH